MVIRQRARLAEDKEVRRNAILDAAETVYLGQGGRELNMAEVAAVAGLAKGTLYLYFPGKEELLLALHERHAEGYFQALGALLANPAPVNIDQILALVQKHMVEPPAFLPLASRCLGLMDQNLPEETAVTHAAHVGTALEQLGAALEHRFPALLPGVGTRLLMQSYVLIVGLWQLLQKPKNYPNCQDRIEVRFLRRDYPSELDQALRALWLGYTEPRSGAPLAAPQPATPVELP